jgi:hypothetical protein
MENQKDTNTVIVIKDSIAEVWADSSGPNQQEKKRQPIQGKVEIYETDENGRKQLVRKSNLVVYKGREWAAVRLTNLNNPAISPDSTAYICWFGVGTGGVAGSDPFDPTPPNNQDDDLAIDSLLNAANSTGSLGDYRVGIPGYYKTLFDSIDFEQDIYNDNRYLVIKFIATIGTTLANGEEINEAGLFAAGSNTPGVGSTGPFYLFARVTFPTILKNTLRTLTFVWYIYV